MSPAAILGSMVPFGIMAMIAAIVLVPRYLRSRERIMLQDTLRAAIEKGQPLPPEVVEALTTNTPVRPTVGPERDLRVGIVWLGVGIGLAAFAFMMGFEDPDATYPLMGIAAFPAFIGIAFLIMAFVARNRK